MDREEAIIRLNRFNKIANKYDRTAFELAIKALEQEPDAIHNEREQAYMKGYEDASKRYRTEPCEDAISRSDAIRVASGYCHWTNIPDELAKLPSVNPIPCEDAISRQKVLEGLASIAKAKAKSDAQKSMMGRTMFFVERMPSVSMEKTGRWIPVSEKLPEDGIYLVTAERTTGKPRVGIKSYAKDLNRVDDFDFPKHKCGWYDYDSEYGYWEDTDVIAWMPLPQPYEPQESEE